MKKFMILLVLMSPIVLVSCNHTHRSDRDERETIAVAQRDLRLGMSQTEVASIMGSPNMVTTDSQRRESWVYDRVATTGEATSSGFGFLFVGGGRQRVTQNQRTMTVIIHFDEDRLVRDFAYRSASF